MEHVLPLLCRAAPAAHAWAGVAASTCPWCGASGELATNKRRWFAVLALTRPELFEWQWTPNAEMRAVALSRPRFPPPT